MIESHGQIDYDMVPSLTALLSRYAETLVPWARRICAGMLDEVDTRDREAWRALGFSISSALRHEIMHTPVGNVMRSLMHEQVDLIRSLPTEAAERVHRLTLKGLESSTRSPEIAREIARSGEVCESRAVLIARTEVSRTSTVLTQARAEHIGCTHYVWQTSEDGDVRPGHREMQGKVCEWKQPPAVNENGRVMHFHAGCIWNCRCWCQPVIDIRRIGR